MQPDVPAPRTEVADAAPDQERQITALDAFGLTLADYRREAIDGRSMLGIEDEWLEDEEFYIGVDDANRAEYRSTWRQQKPAASGAITTASKDDSIVKSHLFLNITRAYVDAAAARMADMLLPADDRCWAIEPTPLPELQANASADVMMQLADGFEVSQKVFYETVQEVAKEYAERAARRIDDWMSESQFSAKARLAIETAAKLGTAVLKGPFPKSKRKLSWTFDPLTGRNVKQVKMEQQPATEWVDPWNFFPDPACGENLQDGNYVFERDYLTQKRLMELRHREGYIPEQIEACLREGPIQPELMWTPTMEIERTAGLKTQPFEIWYYHGMVEIENLMAAGVDVTEVMFDRQTGEPARYVSAIVTMVNHRVIRASLSPLDDGTFPYDLMVWQRRPGMPWGIGVARQIRAAQRMLLAASRNLMDNAGLSAGPQIVINSAIIEPVDGRWELRPRKLWRVKEGVDPDEPIDVKEAFNLFSIETRQSELLNIINFALRMAEEATGLPMILQGQMGEKGADTLGGMKMLQNNASAVLRRLAIMFDEQITIPHVTRYYQWLMEYGPDESEKGDYCVRGRGSSTLVEREIQNQELVGILEVSKDPAFELSPAKTVEEYLRSRRFDPKKFKPDPMEMLATQGIVQPGAPLPAQGALPPPDPRVEADKEKVRAMVDEKAKDRDHEKEMALLEINARHAEENSKRAAEAAAPA